MPGNWECQGHSFPIYTNFQYPWPITAPFVPEDNPTGCYRKHFTIPPSWKGKRCGPFLLIRGYRFMTWYKAAQTADKVCVHCRITIHFEAVNNAFYVWLNGQLLGYSQDSCLPAEFDVTDVVSTEQNTLTVQVRAEYPSHDSPRVRIVGFISCHQCNTRSAATGHEVQRWQLP